MLQSDCCLPDFLRSSLLCTGPQVTVASSPPCSYNQVWPWQPGTLGMVTPLKQSCSFRWEATEIEALWGEELSSVGLESKKEGMRTRPLTLGGRSHNGYAKKLTPEAPQNSTFNPPTHTHTHIHITTLVKNKK